MQEIFIDGQEGTTGLKLAEKLKNRNDIKLIKISDADRKNPKIKGDLLNQVDLAFLCLPDEAAKESVSLVTNKNVKIIDASTAHRTEDGWLYGLPELYNDAEERFLHSTRIAVPGCHAGGFVSIVKPLIDSNIISKNQTLSCTSLTGYSGGGKKMIAEYQSDSRNLGLNSPRPYGLSQNHKHLKEMQFICGLTKKPLFMPIVFDFYSGMAVSLLLDLTEKNIKKEDVFNAYIKMYAKQPLIKVYLDKGESVNDGFINSNQFFGRDDMEITVNGNDERIIITAVFDNLGKGASGAAIECMNLALGKEKTEGLNFKESI